GLDRDLRPDLDLSPVLFMEPEGFLVELGTFFLVHVSSPPRLHESASDQETKGISVSCRVYRIAPLSEDERPDPEVAAWIPRGRVICLLQVTVSVLHPEAGQEVWRCMKGEGSTNWRILPIGGRMGQPSARSPEFPLPSPESFRPDT
ncbi:MAG: hypothetical protein GKC07_08550, partial [Methanomicrobiales archaeon]|nr:hypothetical protein [Methanomicrobiales archaeon]